MVITFVPDPNKADGRAAVEEINVTNVYPSAGASLTGIKLQENVNQFDPVSIQGFRTNCGNFSIFGAFLGLASTSGTAGQVIQIITAGEVVNPGWNWSPGSPVYLFGTGLSNQMPSSGYLQQIGSARDATTLELRPSVPVQL